MTSADQSTQVNFPILATAGGPVKKLRRHNTYANIYNPLGTNYTITSGANTKRPHNNHSGGGHFHRRSQQQQQQHNSYAAGGNFTAGQNQMGNGSILHPRSLYLRAEAFNAHVAYNQVNSLQRVPMTVSDFREHSPSTGIGSISGNPAGPFSKLSCSASVISDGIQSPGIRNDGPNSYTHQHMEYMNYGPSSRDVDSHHCTCFHVPQGSEIPTPTPDGLSWRRLHMSRAKLKATATTSELLSGFAMVAMVELQINEHTKVPEWLFVLFAVCTTVLVAVHIFALMISTYILPNIDAISKLDVCELVRESPHERMRGFIELAWAFSTVLGLFLFLVEVAILCWVKFWDYSFTAAIAATVIVIPVLIVFILFAVHFHHSLVTQKCHTTRTDMEKLEIMKRQLDEVSSQA